MFWNSQTIFHTYIEFPLDIRNSKQLRCPPAAAKCAAFILFIVFNLGLHLAFVTNHFTISKYPKRAARWSGVCPELSVTSGFSLHSWMKYFTQSSFPWVQASCNGEAPFLAFTFAFIPTFSTIHLMHSSLPYREAWCKAVAPKLSTAKGTERRKDWRVWISPSRAAERTFSASSAMVLRETKGHFLFWKLCFCSLRPQAQNEGTILMGINYWWRNSFSMQMC